jgi:hypothetical protein
MNPTDSGQNDGSLALSQSGAASDSAGAAKTVVCHIPPGNPANAHTITIGNPAVAAHLAHGDKLGSCEERKPGHPRPCPDRAPQSREEDGMAPDRQAGKVAVCHIPPGNPANAHTIVVGIAAVSAHLAHGDKLGACAAESVSHPPMSVDCGEGHGHGQGGNSDGGSNGDGGSVDTTGGSESGSTPGSGT